VGTWSVRTLKELAAGGALNGLVHGLDRHGIAIRAIEHPVERRNVCSRAADHNLVLFENELNPVVRLETQLLPDELRDGRLPATRK
jgi:hypothetical protein